MYLKFFLLTLLIALPLAVRAEQRLTYRCDGIESTSSLVSDTPRRMPVTRFYTLYIDKAGGRWFNWDERMWYPIRSISTGEFRLAFDSVGGISWTLSIKRENGAWHEVWAGGQMTTSDEGNCMPVKLRLPPSP